MRLPGSPLTDLGRVMRWDLICDRLEFGWAARQKVHTPAHILDFSSARAVATGCVSLYASAILPRLNERRHLSIGRLAIRINLINPRDLEIRMSHQHSLEKSASGRLAEERLGMGGQGAGLGSAQGLRENASVPGKPEEEHCRQTTVSGYIHNAGFLWSCLQAGRHSRALDGNYDHGNSSLRLTRRSFMRVRASVYPPLFGVYFWNGGGIRSQRKEYSATCIAKYIAPRVAGTLDFIVHAV